MTLYSPFTRPQKSVAAKDARVGARNLSTATYEAFSGTLSARVAASRHMANTTASTAGPMKSPTATSAVSR